MLKIASQSVSFEGFENDLVQGILPSLDRLFLKLEYESWPLRKLAGLYMAKKTALCVLSLKELSYLDLSIAHSYNGQPKITLINNHPNLISLDVLIIETSIHASAITVGRFSQ